MDMLKLSMLLLYFSVHSYWRISTSHLILYLESFLQFSKYVFNSYTTSYSKKK